MAEMPLISVLDDQLVSFPDLLAKAYLPSRYPLLARPSLEGLVHGSDFY
jgi:hypothetical protein